ncbi:Methyltransferase [Zostera marina]|uniref:tRNA N(3)-methylcytidine methyltransferase n=1 Tax=Zostera marina TaxID=29655 RepID=A0A0K9PQ33_ZOSMR|nr:Methyltransferase [Zostera marina]
MAAVDYHSKDFDWADLREEIEKDPSFHYHLAPFDPSSSSSTSDSEAWRTFHRRHSTGRFFKERRYLLNEFPDLVDRAGRIGSTKVLEVGCGNGSTALPFLRAKEDIIVYACDCSMEALDMAKKMIDAADKPSIKNRFHTFLLDFSENEFPKWLFCHSCRSTQMPKQIYYSDVMKTELKLNSSSLSERTECCISGFDFVSMIFTLSAVSFQKMPFVIKECFSILKPGGLLLFRDYGLYDMSMLRFPSNQRTGFREYMRSDGTLSYFFSLDVTRDLFLNVGFLEMELEYCCIRSLNRNSRKNMRRVWIHGKFQKPI